MEELMMGVGLIILFILIAAIKKLSGFAVPSEIPASVPNSVARWAKTAQKWAAHYGLPWQIVLAQIWQESTGDPEAIGSSGEIGLMQLKQIAANDLALEEYDFPGDWYSNPKSNIATGVAYLHLQYTRAGTLADALGKVKADALESYNEGYATAIKDIRPDQYSREVIEKAQILGYVV